MDKDRIQQVADRIAQERYGRDYYALSWDRKNEIAREAEQEVAMREAEYEV